MKKKILFLLIALVASISLLAQKQEKIYYDKDWKGCSQSKAEYYRLITFDSDGKPVGKVFDYYITGELQWEGILSFFTKSDDLKNIQEGLCIWYYKNGKKSRESNFIMGKEEGVTTFWHENGNKARIIEFKNGVPVGQSIDYYENGKIMREAKFSNGKIESDIYYYESGKLYRKLTYADGKLANKFFLECDEFGKCQNVFYENFYSSDNVNQWWVGNNKDIYAEILSKKGLLMKDKTGNGFKSTINIPLNLTDNFSIETIIDFKDGETNNGHGLIWGGKDWDNYSYFVISANGHYRIGTEAEGIHLPIKAWTKTNVINQKKQRNSLKLLRIDDKVYFSINGQLIHSDNFYGFRGNSIGFYTLSGKKEVLFENLIVKQDVSNTGSSISSSANSNSEWRGNGSGFFIDYRGYIATNYHVVKDATQIEVNFIRDGQQQAFKAEVIQSDKQNDLAILKITDNLFKPFTSIPYNFQTTLCDVGTNIFALGYPMADIMGSEIKFTDGKISSRTGVQGDITMYQISVPIQSGNSGGALFDYDGNLVGITSAGLNRDYFNSENVNYAIKSSYLKNLIEVLPVSIQLPNDKTIATKTLTEKIKILSDYVVLIKIK